MGMKRLGGLLLACAVFVGGAGVTAVNAAEESYWDRAAVEIIVARATGSVDFTVSAEGTATASNSFSMEAGETVTINCSYSPASASIDFGLIAPDGTLTSIKNAGGYAQIVTSTGEYQGESTTASGWTKYPYMYLNEDYVKDITSTVFEAHDPFEN